MTSLQCVPIIGSDQGLRTDVKPFLIPEKAWQTLQNAYAFRERTIKRENLKLLGRLRRSLTAVAGGNYSTINGTNTYSIFTGLGINITQPDASIEAGNLTAITIAFGAPINQTLTNADSTGVMTVVGAGAIQSATINYATGVITITANAAVGPAAVTITLAYYPGLPVMGIYQREVAGINIEETVFFDTIYSYRFTGGAFEVLGTATWTGSDSDFFWCTNYRGIGAEIRLFFATNFNQLDPIRYFNGAAWIDFAPLVSATDTLFQARIIIPYYGRLLMLNTWEGTTAGGAAVAANFFNRCRFSRIGSPVAVDSFRSDQFGKGGFIDAPVNEEIVSVGYIKNTLIVFFERSTWQLRYVGEYGLPFIWERVSSDYGSESTCSVIRFDPGLLAVGDKGLIKANALTVERNDEQVPELVFQIRNANDGTKRVVGVRHFEKELVYWCYSNAEFNRTFPNTVIVYNYRNNTYGFFRDNVTFFGIFQLLDDVLWGDFNVYWNDFDTFWNNQSEITGFPAIVSGNQQGYVHFYAVTTSSENAPMLSIQAIDATLTPVNVIIPNHNLEEGELIQITNVVFTTSTDLNDRIYYVARVDDDTINLLEWDGTAYVNVTSASVGTYTGLGEAALLPLLFAQTKDFNPYLQQGNQMKMSYLDFLVDTTESAYTVQLFANASPSIQANLITGQSNTETTLDPPYYGPSSSYAWHRFFATVAAQFVNVVFTYDDNLSNDIETHRTAWQLNAINLWVRPGGKLQY